MEGGGRAVGGGGRQLVDLLDADIAGGKDPRDLRAAVLTRRDVARLREGELPLEELCVRDNADVDENRIDRQRLLRARILVQEIDGRKAILAIQMRDLRLEHDRHLWIGIERIL